MEGNHAHYQQKQKFLEQKVVWTVWETLLILLPSAAQGFFDTLTLLYHNEQYSLILFW